MPSVYLIKYPIHVALAQRAKNKPANGWDMVNPNFRHRAVMALFDQIDSSTPRSEAGILFRTEYLAGQAPFFLIQSLIAPVNLPDGAEMKQIELPTYPQGTQIHFQASINAIRRDSKHGSNRYKAIPVPFDGSDEANTYSSMTPWLQQKLAPALSEVTITNHRRELLGADRTGRTANAFTVQVDTVAGVAVVANEDALNALMLNGVGRAKSYGCGLITVQAI
ncbi:type I-E CRISPR-associated protein Cas6/Cse3/CasE [Arcanobacterium hippocoleae]|uniref:CRISPR system Cascade subunit CasE n=1 Tax=Arcanobacterium hippocoleae TaxID=149017 RepID=A0ABU1T306_9ACTO|nr:type I-E CRISPR-associated protein Cas6/Cse3/CasE [Arcanobacterium hippocoleae]MDR6939703.1 CRISPR system Cascade subunit CasE [Arcanobacterium hippocoleae]